ncbi:MAG: hypothetical protein ACK5QX_02665, partial [bacterium]
MDIRLTPYHFEVMPAELAIGWTLTAPVSATPQPEGRDRHAQPAGPARCNEGQLEIPEDDAEWVV